MFIKHKYGSKIEQKSTNFRRMLSSISIIKYVDKRIAYSEIRLILSKNKTNF